MNLKVKLNRLSEDYLAALRTHLKPGLPANLLAAQMLGRMAVGLGLETLELARIHERAFAAVELSSDKSVSLQQSENFFNEANLQIEETHRASRRTTVHLSELQASLDQRTTELTATNRKLKRGVTRCQVMKIASDKIVKDHQKCLKESLQLQNRLRQLTHQVLTAQENERSKISHELQDEIAQTLLGINVRLLTLKQAARTNSSGLKKEITSAQRLVVRSAQSMRQAARRIRNT